MRSSVVRHLFAATLPGAVRPVDVVEAGNADLVRLERVRQHALPRELLPAVGVAGRHAGVLFPQRGALRRLLQRVGVDAGGGGVDDQGPSRACGVCHSHGQAQVGRDDGVVVLALANEAHAAWERARSVCVCVGGLTYRGDEE